VSVARRVTRPSGPGFGKSDKYTDPSHYTHELHCMVLRKLLDHLQLKEITLVCQDWSVDRKE
jgi:haloalkane dehalogenase